MEVFIAIVTAILLVLMGLSLYFINYRAFHAAEAVNDQATPETSLDSLVAHTEEAVSAFPPLAVFPRRLSLRQTGALWGALSREDKARALVAKGGFKNIRRTAQQELQKFKEQ